VCEGCLENSLAGQVFSWQKVPNTTFLATAPMPWVDGFVGMIFIVTVLMIVAAVDRYTAREEIIGNKNLFFLTYRVLVDHLVFFLMDLVFLIRTPTLVLYVSF
jgi:hypothetical protein